MGRGGPFQECCFGGNRVIVIFQIFRRGAQEFRSIGADGKDDLNAAVGIVLVVVEGETLPHLTCCVSDDRIGVGVVVGQAVENLDAKGALLELIHPARQSMLNNVLQQRGIPFAVTEVLAGEDLLQLEEHRIPVLGRVGIPCLPSWSKQCHQFSSSS